MPLQQTFDAFKANFEAGGPPYHAGRWVHDLVQRATDELIASGAAARALKAGARIPDFRLIDSQGTRVSSGALLAKGPLIVSFYRGVWCPYCNIELRALQASLPDIEKRGASLVAISPQTQVYSRRSVRQNKVSFAVLSDSHNHVATTFGLRFTLPDYLIDLYKTVFDADLAIVNADDSWTLPMPARYVVSQDGKIIYAEVNPDHTCRPDPQELLPALDKARALG